MAAGVGQRFLDDAEDGALQGRGQSLEPDVVYELDFRLFAFLGFAGQVVDRRHDSGLVEDRRPQPADQSPRFIDAPANERQPHVEGLPGVRRFLGVQFAKALQVVQGTGEILAEAVVDLIGGQLPVSFVQVEQLPQQPLFLLNRLGAPFPLGDVRADGHQAANRPVLDNRHQASRPPAAAGRRYLDGLDISGVEGLL